MSYLNAIRKYRNGEAVTVAVMGNSIGCGYYAAGYGFLVEETNHTLTAASRIDHRVRSWAIQLREKLQSRNSNSDMLNYSCDGGDTRDALGVGTYFTGGNGPVAMISALATKPDLVLIPLAVNDRGHGITLSEFKSNTASILSQFISAGIPPVIALEDGTYWADWADWLHAAIMTATSLGVPVIDAYTPLHSAGASAMYDYLHPNQIGNNAIFSAYNSFFNQSVSKKPSTFAVGDGSTAWMGQVYLGDGSSAWGLEVVE